MPLKPIDYSKTIFYRLVCNDLNIKDCYVGQTTNFIKRKQCHKHTCNNENSKSFNLNVYKFIRENGGWINWSMIMIEQISCENFNETSKIERKFLEEYNATLNKAIPIRTDKEKKDKMKEYYENNKDKLKEYGKEYQKEYYENNKDKIKEYIENNKDKIKEYYENNKDKKNQYQREYYREKITCECGIILRRGSISKHKKSNIHQKNLNKQL